jgi:cupin fold WbuC family metalloprotein
MNKYEVPLLSDSEIQTHFDLAYNSVRNRSPKILHKKGDYFNQVFNFILEDSYMHPHLHPGKEKIEKMYLIKGSFALIMFNEMGHISQTKILEEGKLDFIEVPAFTWHTYVMLSEEVVIYETMEGVYEPKTWKNLARWAPEELTSNSALYLNKLREQISFN